MKRYKKDKWTMIYAAGLLAVAILGTVMTADAGVSIPNTFISGSTISSGAMNANFTAVANQMPGAKTYESGGGTQISTSSSTSQMYSIQVTTPGAGYIIVYASGSIYNAVSAASEQMFRIRVSNSANDVNELPGVQFIRYPASAGTYMHPYSIVKMFTVSAAGTYTYYLNMWHQLGSTSSTSHAVDDTTLTAVFVPNALP